MENNEIVNIHSHVKVLEILLLANWVTRLVKTIHWYMKQLHNHFLPSKKFNNSQIQNISLYCSLSKAKYQLAYFDAVVFIRSCSSCIIEIENQ